MALNISEIWPDVKRVVAPNPGPKTLEGTNLYFVGPEPGYLIDAGPADDEFTAALASWLDGRLAGILLTHGHPDHAGGGLALSARLGVPIWRGLDLDGGTFTKISTNSSLAADQTFAVGRKCLRAISAPGHSGDHFCFVLEPDGLLFAGDNILGRGTTLVALPEGDMTAHVATLRSLRDLDPAAIAPGHGPFITDPRVVIEEYLAHRESRERAVLLSLPAHPALEALVDDVYGPLGPEIRRLAILSAGAQLAKLEREGRIEKTGVDTYRVRAES